MLIVTNAVTLEAYKSAGNCIGWEEQSFPSSYRHNQSLCGLVDWALTKVQPRAWEACSRQGSALTAQAELNLWEWHITCRRARLLPVTLHFCVPLNRMSTKIFIQLAKWGHFFAKWGHFCWSPQPERTVCLTIWVVGIAWARSPHSDGKSTARVFVCFVFSEASGAVKTVVSPREWARFAAVCVFSVSPERKWSSDSTCINMQLRSTHTRSHTNQSLSKRLGGFLLFWRRCNASPIEYQPSQLSWVLLPETTACIWKRVRAHFPV